jgi:prephenate dehydratase
VTSAAYLGPAGTFTHEAARRLAPDAGELVPLGDTAAVVEAVEAGTAATGVIPFESSVEGEVTIALDALALRTERCVIQAETILPVSFSLFRRPGDAAPLRGVASIPVALAQCAGWLRRAGAEVHHTASTAEACAWLADGGPPGWGAVAAPGAGALYGLRTAETGLEDERGAVTRFVRLGHVAPPPSGRDRTGFVVRPERDSPGSLVRILQQFSLRGINLHAITSRPVKGALGEYLFYLECEGHLLDDDVRAAAIGVLELPMAVRYLGSFPEDPSRGQRPPPPSHAAAVAGYERLAAQVARRP